MSELSDLMKLIAEEKAKNPKAQQATIAKENAKGDLGSLFAQLSEAKANDPKTQLLKQVKEHVAGDISTLFGKLNQKAEEAIITEEPVAVESEIIEQVEELVDQVVVIEKVEEKSAVEQYAEAIKEAKPFAQPEVPKVAPEMKMVTDKLKFLEQWVAKISAAGPGSGEVNFRYLDDVNRSSIEKDRQLMYDPVTKKFLFVDTRVSIEAFDRSANIPLLTTPQILKPSSFTNSKNLTYDPATGVFTFLTQCEVTLALTVNALAVASNQRVYQYAEKNSGSGWVPIQNSGKSYQLTNTQHTQIVNAQTISRQAGEQIRYFIFTGEVGKVSLVTETLPNVTDVYVPAIRIQYAGR